MKVHTLWQMNMFDDQRLGCEYVVLIKSSSAVECAGSEMERMDVELAVQEQ